MSTISNNGMTFSPEEIKLKSATRAVHRADRRLVGFVKAGYGVEYLTELAIDYLTACSDLGIAEARVDCENNRLRKAAQW